MKLPARGQSGFSLVELLLGITLGTFVLAGIYRLWSNNSEQGNRIQSKIELRNQLALSTKRLNRSITIAGIGLDKVVGLTRIDAIGSDTLNVYTNPDEARTTLVHNYTAGETSITVTEASLFQGIGYVVLANGGSGEVRRVSLKQGAILNLESGFENDYASGSAKVFPANREQYYTDQQTQKFVMVSKAGSAVIIAHNVQNFQVAFRNKAGEATDDLSEVRFVNYSLTGIYPAREGALNSMVYSSTSIPRNIL